MHLAHRPVDKEKETRRRVRCTPPRSPFAYPARPLHTLPALPAPLHTLPAPCTPSPPRSSSGPLLPRCLSRDVALLGSVGAGDVAVLGGVVVSLGACDVARLGVLFAASGAGDVASIGRFVGFVGGCVGVVGGQ